MALKKGSAAAKAFMAKLRASRGKQAAKKVINKKIGLNSYGKNPFTFDVKATRSDGINVIQKRYVYADNIKQAKINLKNFLTENLNYTKITITNGRAGHEGIKKLGAVKKVMPKKLITHKYNTAQKVNTKIVSGYTQKPEIILGRVGALSLLKSLAPEVKLRITRGKKVRTNTILSAMDTQEILKKFITPAKIQTQEYSLAMFLNNANNVLAVYQFGMGSITSTPMDRRLLMAAALKLGATAIILCHNHPSGNLTPSKADKEITKEFSYLASIHDIKLMDHVILTKDGYFSFAQEGLI